MLTLTPPPVPGSQSNPIPGEGGFQGGRAAVRSADGGFSGSDPSPAGGGAARRARGPAEKRRHDADQPSSQDVGPGAFCDVGLCARVCRVP